jgi:NADPH:quinone reductase-like Zn-dependent oxidoreductase
MVPGPPPDNRTFVLLKESRMTVANWTAALLPDLMGRTIIVTGATSGLGKATADALAYAGAHVVLAVRNPAKGQAVAEGIAGDTEVRELDLSSLSSVRAFASSWHRPIDVLINNAGIMQVPEARTADLPCQGTTLVVPKSGNNILGPRPCTRKGRGCNRLSHTARPR